MAIRLKIAGQYDDRFNPSTLRVSLAMGSIGQCSFTMLHPGETQVAPPGARVVMLDGSSRIWSGYVAGRTTSGGREADERLKTVVQSQDLKRLLAKRLVNGYYTDEYVHDIVADLVTTYAPNEGIDVTSEVDQLGPRMKGKRWIDVYVHRALDELAEDIGWYWDLRDDDGTLKLHFKPRAQNPAPWNLTQAHRGKIVNLSVKEDLSDLANRIKVVSTSGVPPTIRDKEYKAVAGQDEIGLTFEPRGLVTRVLINGVAQTIGRRGVGEDVGASAASTPDSRILQLESSLSADDVVDVQYETRRPLALIDEDADSIATRQAVEGGSGVYERVFSGGQWKSYEAMATVLGAALRRFGRIRRVITFKSWHSGWRPGQTITFDLRRWSLSSVEATIVSVDGVGRHIADPLGGRGKGCYMLWTVTCAEGEPLENWDQLLRRAFDDRTGRDVPEHYPRYPFSPHVASLETTATATLT